MGYMDWKDEVRDEDVDGLDEMDTPSGEKKLKTIMIVLSVVVVVLVGALAVIWWQKNSLINDLNIEIIL